MQSSYQDLSSFDYNYPSKGDVSNPGNFFENLAVDDLDFDIDQASTPPPEFLDESLRDDYEGTPFDPYPNLNTYNSSNIQPNYDATISYDMPVQPQLSQSNYQSIDYSAPATSVTHVHSNAMSGGVVFEKGKRKKKPSVERDYCPSNEFDNLCISEESQSLQNSNNLGAYYADTSRTNNTSPYMDDFSTSSVSSPLSPACSEASSVRNRRSLKSLSEDEKHDRIRHQNNIASKEYRQRRKANAKGTESTGMGLKEQNDALRRQEKELQYKLRVYEAMRAKLENDGFTIEGLTQNKFTSDAFS